MAGAPGVPGAAAATARRGRGAGTTRSLDLVTTTTTTTWSLDLVTGAARKPRPSNVQQVEADSFADLCTILRHILETTTNAPTATTTTTTLPPGSQMMHKDNQYEYYKVTAAVGTKMTNDKVSETCESAGMKPVCHGPGRTCSHDDLANRPHRCYVTPLSIVCGNPM